MSPARQRFGQIQCKPRLGSRILGQVKQTVNVIDLWIMITCTCKSTKLWIEVNIERGSHDLHVVLKLPMQSPFIRTFERWFNNIILHTLIRVTHFSSLAFYGLLHVQTFWTEAFTGIFVENDTKNNVLFFRLHILSLKQKDCSNILSCSIVHYLSQQCF